MDRPTKLAFVDTETTGLSHLSRPWEIAVVLRETPPVEYSTMDSEEVHAVPGRTVESEHLFQVDYKPSTLPDGTQRQALDVGRWRERGWGISGDHYREGLINQGVLTALGPEWTVAQSIHELLQGATLIGVGVHYDAEVLGRMFLRHGLPWQPWHYDIRDLKTMTRGYIRGRIESSQRYGGPPPVGIDALTASSDELAAWLGVRPPADDERHTALGDARWGMRWWDTL